jgi:hypothetical protein
MNLYVLDPVVAGASQDNDPTYQNSEFNNFNRVDTFDSDLWNNNERFTPEEIQTQLAKSGPLNIEAALMIPEKKKTRCIALNTCELRADTLYESKWLQELFQSVPFIIESVAETQTFNQQKDDLIVVLSKPKWKEQLQWLNTLRKSYTFKILHLSDEFGSDPIHMYSWPEVTGVMRFYSRPDLDQGLSKVLIVPLGYHWQFKGLEPPSLSSREYMWSFVGTDWFNRSKDLQGLEVIQPKYTKYYSDWNDQSQLKNQEYISLLVNTKCIPCPRGQNIETFRFYEALECGCIPLCIDLPEFANEMPFLKVPNWEHATALLQHFQSKPEQMEHYRTMILSAWAKYKTELKHRVLEWLHKN